MRGARYIAIEGPIGVGKTSLARLISNELNGTLLCEQVEENPFLKDFYRDRKKFSFQTQLYFLLNRYQQQVELNQCDLFSSTIISDYVFAKDRIFAYMNLNENEVNLYEKIYKLLDAKIPKPDLVIFLQASPEVLIERVKIRNRDYENEIDTDYLQSLMHAYNEFFFHYDESPLLVINSSEIDFVNNSGDFDLLMKEIREMRGGVKHLVPLGSG
ncbi:MAG: deoxynucleoside kinase [Deltaproteobacteria bacterium]|nr:deoxynucleoside kinase [Deltaproteobacteria bacterium]